MNIKQRVSTFTVSSLAWLLPATTFATSLDKPFGNNTEPVYIIGAIVQALLGVVGAVTLLIFVWGGFMMIFAAGNEEKIRKGRTTLIWAVIGLGIILSSYAILSYIFATLQASTL